MTVPRVMKRQGWVMQQHSWTRIPHNDLDFFFHARAVAVDQTFAARAFFVLEWAFVKAQKSVFFEFFAFGA